MLKISALKAKLFFWLAIFYSGSVFSDGDLTRIDSLNKLIGQQSGRERVETLINLSEAYREISIDKSLKAGDEAGKYATDQGFENMKGRILLSMGESAALSGDFALSIDYYEKAVVSFRDNSDYSDLAKALNNIGLVYKNLARYDKAIEYLNKAIEIEKEHALTGQLAGSIGNTATIYFAQGDYNKAMDGYHQARLVYQELKDTLRYAKMTMNVGLVYWQWDKNDYALEMLTEAKTLFEQREDFVELGRVYNNLGMLYYQNVKDTLKALDYFDRSLAIRELLGNQLGMAVVLANIGNVYRDRNQMVEAFDRYNKSLRISEAIGYKEGIALTCYYIGIAHQRTNHFGESNVYFDRCRKLADENGLKSYASIVNEAKLKNYAALGDYKEFMSEFKVFSSERDTLKAQLNDLQIKEAEARYKINELIPELDRLEEENNRQAQMLLIYRSILSTAILLLIIVLVVRYWRSNKKSS